MLTLERDDVERFNLALTEASAFANDNPDAARQSLAEFTDTPPEAIENIVLPHFGGDLGETPEMTKSAIEYGILDSQPDYDALWFSP